MEPIFKTPDNAITAYTARLIAIGEALLRVRRPIKEPRIILKVPAKSPAQTFPVTNPAAIFMPMETIPERTKYLHQYQSP